MFDYQILKIKFSQRLGTFGQEELLRWIDFDRNREAVSKLIAGETIKIENSILNKLIQFDERENISCEAGESNYAMAA